MGPARLAPSRSNQCYPLDLDRDLRVAGLAAAPVVRLDLDPDIALATLVKFA